MWELMESKGKEEVAIRNLRSGPLKEGGEGGIEGGRGEREQPLTVYHH